MSKHELLAYLARVGGADAYDAADALAVPYPTAAMALLRAARAGLVTRGYDPTTGTFRYALSDRGTGRLTYLNALEQTQKDKDDPPSSRRGPCLGRLA